ncbi:MAG: hypothetical protein U1E02_37230 [Hydrogenophaga sp.]|jgi:hypothetical protein|nr:hypothetical protein [Hydrogenophaga sp.]
MKRSSDIHQPSKSRRALLRNLHPEMLTDPAVVAFLDGADPDPTKHPEITRSLVMANEPELFLAFVAATGGRQLTLSADPDDMKNAPPLPDGLLDHVAEHINELSAVTSLVASTALLTPAACAKLQTSLLAPGCKLTALTFIDCAFADPHAPFVLAAPTVKDFSWSNDYAAAPPVRQMDRVLTALAHWTSLECVTLGSMGAALNFVNISQLLLANPKIIALQLFSNTAPANPGPPANPSPENPIHLFENLRNNRTHLTQLHFEVADRGNHGFNFFCIQCIAACLTNNTTLQALMMPGIALCSGATRVKFEGSLGNNRSLTTLGPTSGFGQRMPPPIVANANRHIWFSQEFLLGAVSEFMRQWGTPHELGVEVTRGLDATPYERTYCAAIVAQLCKATNAAGIRMRSAALALAIKEFMHSNNMEACLALMHSLSAPGLGLEPADKADVVRYATAEGRLNCLPAGYAS